MDKKILVAYGSKRGSTAEIAERIGETLRQKGLQVDVLDTDTVNNLAPYSKEHRSIGEIACLALYMRTNRPRKPN